MGLSIHPLSPSLSVVRPSQWRKYPLSRCCSVVSSSFSVCSSTSFPCKKFPKNSRRWATLSEDSRNRLILRLSQTPPKVFYIWASYKAYVATDEDLISDRNGVRSLALATWYAYIPYSPHHDLQSGRTMYAFRSVAAVMYMYELIGTSPGEEQAISTTTADWVYLTYFGYSSPMATQGEPQASAMVGCYLRNEFLQPRHQQRDPCSFSSSC